MAAHISVQHLSRVYRVPVREAGLVASLKSLWARTYREVEAVKDVSFSIERGEIVGFLGPNGAGKTTTLKMLSGLLYPTVGEVQVAGFVPWKREADYLRRISMVMGNKNQLNWDLPALDSFLILGETYRVPRGELKKRIDELVDLLELSLLVNKQVRTLSLGERMKCELAALLIYRPQVLFLDEPTLGLDITMQQRLRAHFAEYNRRSGATIILTSHYMADIEALCSRVLLIHQGSLLYDGNLHALARRFAPYKLLSVTIDQSNQHEQMGISMLEGVKVIEWEQATWKLQVLQTEVPSVAAHLLNSWPVVDLTIAEPPIETVIETIYREGAIR